MNQPYTLRDATAADVPDILRLLHGLATYEKKLNEFTATEAGLGALMFGARQRAFAILAELPGRKPVGMALFNYTISTFTARIGMFLEDLYVEPDLRGTGIGIGLLRNLAGRAVREGCDGIEWRVLNWNQPAIEFYERIGATPVQEWQVRQLRGSALTTLAKGAENG